MTRPVKIYSEQFISAPQRG